MPHLHTETRFTLIVLIIILLGNSLMFLMMGRVLESDLQEQLLLLRQEKEEEIVKELKGRVESAYTVISYFNKKFPRLEAQLKSKQALKDFRFGENNYVWVHLMEPSDLNKARTLVHPAKEIVDQELTGLIDLERAKSIYFNGRIYSKSAPQVSHIRPSNIFYLFNTISFEHGEGVVPYYWPKVEQNQLTPISYRKLSYVKRFPDWNWVIGAGAYADHLDNIVTQRAQLIDASHKKMVAQIFWAVTVLSFIILSCVYYVMYKNNIKRRRAEKALLDSEHQLTTVTTISPVGILRISNTGRITWANKKAKELLGKESPEMQRFSWRRAIQQDDYKKIKTQLPQELTKKGQFSIECRFVQPQGKSVWILAQMVRDKISAGEHAGLVGTLTDISHEKKVEQELKNTRITLLQQEKFAAIGQLAAGVAHEINNPIGFVSSNVAMLEKYHVNIRTFIRFVLDWIKSHPQMDLISEVTQQQDKLDIDFILEDSQELIAETKNGTKRVADIVSNLKDFSGVDQDNLSLTKVDINQCLETSLNVIDSRIKGRGKVIKNLDKVPPILGYANLLNQCFMNILINAFESIQEQGEVTIKTWRYGDNIFINISDTGKGVEKEHIGKVFDPFFTTKAVGEGTGLGLSLVYDVVKKKHAGEITLNSICDKGTSVQITLPIDKNESRA